MLRLFWLWVALVGVAQPVATAASSTTARLIVGAETAKPGDSVLAGVKIEMSPQWHVYWRNPGEAGLATAVEWSLPEGVTASRLVWPPPEVHVAGGITTYVYHEQVVLLATLKLSDRLRAGPLAIKAKVSWLECKDVCVPGEAELEAVTTVSTESKPSGDADLLASWLAKAPTPNPALETRARWETDADEKTRFLLIEGLSVNGFRPLDFLAYPADAYDVGPSVRELPADTGKFRLQKTLKRLDGSFPDRIVGILLQRETEGRSAAAFEVDLDLRAGKNGDAGPPAASKAGVSLWAMLGLAFLGGLILNVMPCVLPVIALKILGFVQQSKETPGRLRNLGFMYAVGVLVSFLVLALVVIAARGAGAAATWGMQMQSPHYRLVLTVVMTLVALNLFGVFEVTLGSGAAGAASQKLPGHGLIGAFFNGVLATALATPCTAPFLTVAVGFAFSQSSPVVLLVFSATAIGLAAPYVVLSWRPQWLRLLPKPGLWMQRFKAAMGFPMLATAIWLFDLTAPSFGEGGVLWLGLFLVLLSVAMWVWGEFAQRSGGRNWPAAVVCLLLLCIGYGWVLEGQLHWRTPQSRHAPGGVVKDSPDGIEWLEWNPAAVQKARAAGQPVLVDFTAKWCLTCKSNKRLALDVPAVRAKLREVNAVAFRADNTDPNPAIAAALKQYDRAGVPLVLVFPAALDRLAIVLPTLLTPSLVLDALDRAAK